jgi:hypothetical protein
MQSVQFALQLNCCSIELLACFYQHTSFTGPHPKVALVVMLAVFDAEQILK